AQQLQPDLILLDIGLPLLHGIAAARKMRDLAPNSKILFVSENRAGDLAGEALRTGAGGYVVKSDAAGELLPAVEAILRDKLYVSAWWGEGERLFRGLRPGFVPRTRHELSLYSDDGAFVADFAHSIEAALENGNAVVVIATESHRANVLQRLRAGGLDVDAA